MLEAIWQNVLFNVRWGNLKGAEQILDSATWTLFPLKDEHRQQPSGLIHNA